MSSVFGVAARLRCVLVRAAGQTLLNFGCVFCCAFYSSNITTGIDHNIDFLIKDITVL